MHPPHAVVVRIIVPLLVLAVVGSMASRPAAASPLPKADLAIVSVAGPHSAFTGTTVIFTTVATNRGPATSALHVNVTLSAGLTRTEMTCDLGVSPDTPSCEYNIVAPGTQLTTGVVATVLPGAGPTETATFCTSNEGLTVDQKTKNDCKTVTVAITG